MRFSTYVLVVGACLAATVRAEAASCSSLQDARWREVSTATFEGSGVTTARADGAILDGEELRLVAMAGAVFYIAKVAHNAYPVAFRMTVCEAGRLVFENPTHDFPRRLEYTRRADGGLDVSVGDGAKRGFKLRFRRLDHS